jgi:hypothetical protein
MGKNHSRAPNIKQPGKSGPKLIRQLLKTTHQGQRISQFKRSQSTSAIELIRRHDSLMFAVALAVRLSILKLMGVDGHSSEALSMWKAFAEEDKKDMECEVIYCVLSESYILYSNVSLAPRWVLKLKLTFSDSQTFVRPWIKSRAVNTSLPTPRRHWRSLLACLAQTIYIPCSRLSIPPFTLYLRATISGALPIRVITLSSEMSRSRII